MTDRGEGGFTLLEVMVAFVIAAIALAALTQGASGGLQATLLAAHEQDALSRARSRLAGLGAGLQAGEQEGDDGGGFRWRTRVQPSLQAGPGRAVLYDVTVTLIWAMDGPERSVALASQRVGRSLAAPP